MVVVTHPRTMTVKVSPEEHEMIQKARAELAKKGYGGAGITEEEMKPFNWETLAMGAIVGIGAYLLWKTLTEE